VAFRKVAFEVCRMFKEPHIVAKVGAAEADAG
jgi:hypothetical protein